MPGLVHGRYLQGEGGKPFAHYSAYLRTTGALYSVCMHALMSLVRACAPILTTIGKVASAAGSKKLSAAHHVL